MSFRWIKQLNRTALIGAIFFLGVGAAVAQSVQLSPEEYNEMFGSNTTSLGGSSGPTVWGNAKMAVEGQETFLKADKITYERNKQIVDAVGNVKIYKEGKMTTGSQFRFNLDSPHYLLDTDKTKVLYVEVKKRGDSRFRQDP